MGKDQSPKFDAEQIARQEEVVQKVRELASKSEAFKLGGGIILEGAEAFEIEVSEHARTALSSFELPVPSIGYGKTNRSLLEKSIQAIIAHVEKTSGN